MSTLTLATTIICHQQIQHCKVKSYNSDGPPTISDPPGGCCKKVSTFPWKRTVLQRSGAPDMRILWKKPSMKNLLITRTIKNKVVLHSSLMLLIYLLFLSSPRFWAGWSYNPQSKIFAVFLNMSKGLSNDSVSDGKEDLVIPWKRCTPRLGGEPFHMADTVDGWNPVKSPVKGTVVYTIIYRVLAPSKIAWDFWAINSRYM